MSYGGSPSCGFDLVNPDGSEAISGREKTTRKQALLNWLEYFYYRAKHRCKSGDTGEAHTVGAKQAYKEIKQVIKNLPEEKEEEDVEE